MGCRVSDLTWCGSSVPAEIGILGLRRGLESSNSSVEVIDLQPHGAFGLCSCSLLPISG